MAERDFKQPGSMASSLRTIMQIESSGRSMSLNFRVVCGVRSVSPAQNNLNEQILCQLFGGRRRPTGTSAHIHDFCVFWGFEAECGVNNRYIGAQIQNLPVLVALVAGDGDGGDLE